jgi:hypothetical protein
MLILIKIEGKIRKRHRFTPLYTSIPIIFNRFTKFMQFKLVKELRGLQEPFNQLQSPTQMNYHFNLNTKLGGLLKPFNRSSTTPISMY